MLRVQCRRLIICPLPDKCRHLAIFICTQRRYATGRTSTTDTNSVTGVPPRLVPSLTEIKWLFDPGPLGYDGVY